MMDMTLYQYDDLLRAVLNYGYDKDNRTPQPTRKLPWGASMVLDMTLGFPAITTKSLNYKACFAEYIGFLRGYSNAEDFAKLGVKWWRKDANLNKDWLGSQFRSGDGDMGRVYGVQWRDWKGPLLFKPEADCSPEESSQFKYHDDTGVWSVFQQHIDQVQGALCDIRNNPKSRRIIIAGWNPAELDQMCLPPCHMTYHFDVNVDEGELNLQMHQRSCDMFLGVPMNIAGAALMLHLFAAATGLRPRYLTMHLDDIHIYHNHLEQVHEQLSRSHYALPSLHIAKPLFGVDADGLAALEVSDLELHGYRHHPPLHGEMSTTT